MGTAHALRTSLRLQHWSMNFSYTMLKFTRSLNHHIKTEQHPSVFIRQHKTTDNETQTAAQWDQAVSEISKAGKSKQETNIP